MSTIKPKILYLVESFGGGVYEYLLNLTNNITNDFDVYIAHGVRQETPTNYREQFHQDIKLIEVKNFSRSINPVKTNKAINEVTDIFESIKPDIVHMHSSIAGGVGRLALRNKEVIQFYTPHGYSFIGGNESSKKKLAYKLLETTLGKLNCTTIACSKSEYNQSIGVTDKSMYINNGIDLSQLPKQNIPLNKRIYISGRISEQKNPSLINELAKLLPDYEFLWIGEGELRPILTSENVKITGWLSKQEGFEASKDYSIFILPSKWEGLSISLLEAMGQGKLCLTSNIEGNQNVIINGVNGFLCDNVNQYVNALRYVEENTEEANKIRNSAKELVNSEYNSTKMVEEYKKVYLDALRKK